ncbi:histone deacetylase family protein [Thalassospira sp. NFXS8]|uniref:histone deacetylase family protein n=1 Tax=Thalassospira sp. NFXS8 TaxID=2819093 RepID=UPI0032DF02A4
MMHAYFSPDQMLHHGQTFMVGGERKPIPEVPERAEILNSALAKLAITPQNPADFGLEPIAQVHSPEYLRFLENIHRDWRAAGGAEIVVPHIHPFDRTGPYPQTPAAQAGFHLGDTSCPVSATTWQSARSSANCAVAAARHVRDDDASCAYALCRPPGHHASREIAGGFCYLNNSAIAARQLRERFGRIAILDIDLHHGNGTQHIFYDCDDVLTLSIHADPAQFYPFYWGHAHERGTGQGLGYNHNFPLPLGSGDDVFLAALDRANGIINHYAPDALVLACGLDASCDDPFGGLTVSTDGFGKIARKISLIGLPTVIVQEGGYVSPTLANNLVQFLESFAEARS